MTGALRAPFNTPSLASSHRLSAQTNFVFYKRLETQETRAYFCLGVHAVIFFIEGPLHWSVT